MKGLIDMEFNSMYWNVILPTRIARLCRARAQGDNRDQRERAYAAAVKRFERR